MKRIVGLLVIATLALASAQNPVLQKSIAVCSDLSNAAASCSTDATNASNLSSGTVALARGGTGVDLSGTGGTSQYLLQNTVGGAITPTRPACSALSNAAASCSTDTTVATNITSGTLPAAQMPTFLAAYPNQPISMVFLTGNGATASANTTQWLLTNGSFNNQNVRQFQAPFAGHVGNLYVTTTGTQTANGALVCSLYIASASPSTVTVTFNAGDTAQTKSDLTHKPSFNQGDALSFGCANAAPATVGAAMGSASYAIFP